MEILRENYQKITSIYLSWTVSGQLGANGRKTCSRFESNLVREAYVANIIASRAMNLNSAVDLLEKLCVSFRIFIEHVHSYGPTMTMMISFINMYIYGVVVIAVWHLRSINNFLLIPICLLLSGWLASNFFILPASNFHAKVSVDGCLRRFITTKLSIFIPTQHIHTIMNQSG